MKKLKFKKAFGHNYEATLKTNDFYYIFGINKVYKDNWIYSLYLNNRYLESIDSEYGQWCTKRDLVSHCNEIAKNLKNNIHPF